MSPPLSPPPASEMAAWEREAERASLEGPTGPLRLYRVEEFDVFEFNLLLMSKIYIK